MKRSGPSAPAQQCRSLSRGERGSVSSLAAILIPVLLGITGLAIDMGNLYLAQARLQSAVDAGALAGSLQLPYDPELQMGLVRSAASNMVKENYEDADIKEIVPGTEVRSVKVIAEVTVPTLIMGLFGDTSNTVSASATAGFNKLEVVFVIDNSGSMKGTPITMVREASIDLVNLIIPDGGNPETKIGLVPFRGKVHLPATDGLEEGCRNVDDTLDEGLRDEYKAAYWQLPYEYRRRVTFNTCDDIPTAQALTNNKYAIVNSINTQTATGDWSGTIISEGIRWGRHILTPEAPFTEGGDPEKIRKIMILLTDGDTEDGKCGGSYRSYYDPNNYWTNAYYGAGLKDKHCQDGGPLNNAMLEEAQLAKDAGIEIFAIRYGSSDNVDKSLMMQIASSKPNTDDHYFDAPSMYDIGDVFKEIGKQLGWRLLR